ncbi:hypothetical protein LL251_20430 [Sphingobium naphthae]|nr:hypothetical protein [Sphingobium naphthae]
MSKLILHVGAPKTGTSALQSAFARNAGALRSAGFIYPEMSNSDIARRGHVTSGNGVGLAKFLNSSIAYNGPVEPIEERLDEAVGKEMNLLYSSEVMGNFRPASMRALRELAAERGMGIHAVMYVRAPVDHAVSAYRQFVKYGYTESLEHYVLNDYKLPYMQIIRKLNDCLARDEISLRNYDSHSGDLFSDFLLNILEIRDGWEFDVPPGKVNRSLTETEISILRTMNKVLDNSKVAAQIGRILVNGDPESSYNLYASREVLEIMEKRYSADLIATNQMLGDDPIQMCRKVEVLDDIEHHLSEAEKVLAYLVGTLFKQGLTGGAPRQAPGGARRTAMQVEDAQ